MTVPLGFGRLQSIAAIFILLVFVIASTALRSRHALQESFLAVVHRGSLEAQLTTSGTLKPIESLTYRSPVGGREVEIVALAPEGTRVKAGDLIARLDSTELQRDADRLRQDLRQLRMELQAVHVERQEAESALVAANEGEGALSVDEAKATLQLAEKKAARLRQEYDQLKPLLDKGVITRDELSRLAAEVDESEENLRLVRKRTNVVVALTHPRETQRAEVRLAQKVSQVENLVGRVQEADIRLHQLLALIESCTIRARRPGLVVYEQFLRAFPRRKIHVGDRVTASQDLVTIPEVNRMVVESTVIEADVHRVKPGQSAVVRLEAFPDLRLAGRVVRVGTVATSSREHAFDDKRFDVIIELDSPRDGLRPEMTALADIVIGKRDNVLLVPVTAVFGKQGAFVAHVADAASTEIRPIELGESNGQFIEVVAGLRENERVLLTDPANDGARHR